MRYEQGFQPSTQFLPAGKEFLLILQSSRLPAFLPGSTDIGNLHNPQSKGRMHESARWLTSQFASHAHELLPLPCGPAQLPRVRLEAPGRPGRVDLGGIQGRTTENQFLRNQLKAHL